IIQNKAVAECSKPAAVLYLVFFFIIGFSSWQAPVCIPGLAFLWKYLYNRILLNSSIQLVHFFVGNGNTTCRPVFKPVEFPYKAPVITKPVYLNKPAR